MMKQVKDGKIVRNSLPKTGTLADGRTVSNYDLLPMDVLLAEGWLPFEVFRPEYDPETEYLGDPYYDIQETKVVQVYQVLPIPEPVPPEPDRMDDMEAAIAELSILIAGGME